MNCLITLLTGPIGEAVGSVALVIAVIGVWLNNHRRMECFYLWLVSNSLSALLHASAAMWAMTARDVIFIALAVHGLWHWRRATTTHN